VSFTSFKEQNYVVFCMKNEKGIAISFADLD
jgi:hypothetical protein